ncbi:MAG: nucleoside-triphosphatase [Bacillota bacterium]
MVDTTLHVVDPKNPAAVDEIIHLGDHWNESGVRSHKDLILKTNREIGRLFRRAYGYLAQAKLLNDEIESFFLDGDALDIAGLNMQANLLIKGILRDNLRQKPPRSRHLFASAITPGGLANHFDTLFDSASKRYILTGEPGTGKSTLVQKVYNATMGYGYDVEAFHCALDPSRLEHLIIPELNVAVITSNEIHKYEPKAEDTVINTGMFVDNTAIEPYTDDMAAAKKLLKDSLQTAVSLISRAKKAHDELENYYIPYMDFSAINLRRDMVLERIINLAKERKEQNLPCERI